MVIGCKMKWTTLDPCRGQSFSCVLVFYMIDIRLDLLNIMEVWSTDSKLCKLTFKYSWTNHLSKMIRDVHFVGTKTSNDNNNTTTTTLNVGIPCLLTIIFV